MDMVAPLEVGICCGDLDRLSKFYVEVLSCSLVNILEVDGEKAHQVRASLTGYRVARLQLPSGERIKLLEPKQPPQVQAPTDLILARRNTSYLTFIVSDLASILRSLAQHGAEILTGSEPIEVRTGVSIVFARDPEENIIEFVHYADIAKYRRDVTNTTFG